MTREPARFFSLVSAALTATLSAIGLVAEIDPKVLGAVGFALAAWVAVTGEVIRSRVTPTQDVALTKDEAAALNANRPVVGP